MLNPDSPIISSTWNTRITKSRIFHDTRKYPRLLSQKTPRSNSLSKNSSANTDMKQMSAVLAISGSSFEYSFTGDSMERVTADALIVSKMRRSNHTLSRTSRTYARRFFASSGHCSLGVGGFNIPKKIGESSLYSICAPGSSKNIPPQSSSSSSATVQSLFAVFVAIASIVISRSRQLRRFRRIFLISFRIFTLKSPSCCSSFCSSVSSNSCTMTPIKRL